MFARWKLAIVLEGSYAKFLRGLSDKPIHEFFGDQVDLLLDSAATIIDRGAGDIMTNDAGVAGATAPASRSTCCTGSRSTVPEPGPGQIRIRVTAAGIGLPDVFMCRGTYPLTPPLPFTPGQEATGMVTAVGDGVDLRDRHADHVRDRVLRGARLVRRGVPGPGGLGVRRSPTA